MKKQKPKRTVYVYRYTLFDVMLASPSEPLAEHLRRHQLTRMHGGLESMEKAPVPTTDDWRVVSDAVNLMETLVTSGSFFETKEDPETGETRQVPIPGHWHGCDGEPVEITDASGLLADAVTAMAMAGKRHRAGGNIRLDGAGIQAVRGVLADYGDLLEALPARTMIKAHRETERRIHEILAGKKKPHDVEVMDL
jgi:hypothetical protein